MDIEKTESLLDEKQEDKKDNKKKKTIIIVAVILALLVAGIGIYSFILYRNQQEYSKNLDLGYKSLDDGDYEAAILAFNEAISISDKEVAPYEGIVQAAIYTKNIPLAQEAYGNLYRITGDTVYEYLEDQVVYGNSNGNISNAGLVVQQGNTTYLVDNHSQDSSFIWKIKDNKPEILTAINYFNTTTQINSGTSNGVSSLNLYGTKLYYLNNNRMEVCDIETGRTAGYYTGLSNNLTSIDFRQFIIYEDKIYFTGLPNTNKSGMYTLYVCDMNGNSLTPIFQSGYVNRFIIDGDYIYAVSANASGESSKLTKISLDNYNETEDIYTGDQELINNFFIVNNELYFSQYNAVYGAGEDTLYGDKISKINLETNETTLLGSPGKVSSMNTDGSSLFYISNKEVYRSDLNLQNTKKIGDRPEPSKDTLSYGVTNSAINLSADSLFVYTGYNTNYYTNTTLNDTIMGAFFSSLDDYAEFDPQINYSSDSIENLFTDEIKDAYKEKLKEITDEEIARNKAQNPNSSSLNDYDFTDYLLFDIDDDGIPELIFDIAPGEATHHMRYFTYQNGSVVDLGETNGAHRGFVGETSSLYGQLILEGGHMDYYTAEYITIKDGKIDSEEFMTSTNLNQFTNDMSVYFYIPQTTSNDTYLLEH